MCAICHTVVRHLGSLVGTAGVKEPHTTNAFHLNNKTQLFCQTTSVVYNILIAKALWSQTILYENSSK